MGSLGGVYTRVILFAVCTLEFHVVQDSTGFARIRYVLARLEHFICRFHSFEERAKLAYCS